ncbi:hypothetical protein BU202_01415 [Streptococcus cuniculi]|uniref:Uncharacterized protein n=1 Tax=Streptococcus cuniculi TaxID=1432788 RepID=A0A1Q8EB12_9STRE|nr:TipC family immunity protein [Streptococcus cuniculi]OLF48970.1 hypothetical protein BU202_01415 [Streptococcus cuniculi]
MRYLKEFEPAELKSAASHAVNWVSNKVSQAANWVGTQVNKARNWAAQQWNNYQQRRVSYQASGPQAYYPSASFYASQQQAQAQAQAVQRRQQHIRDEYTQATGLKTTPKTREGGNLFRNWGKALQKMYKHVCTTAKRIGKQTANFLKKVDWKKVLVTAGGIGASGAILSGYDAYSSGKGGWALAGAIERDIMNKKKTIYAITLLILLTVLLPVTLLALRPRYSNIFEEIYHDEYHHATTAFLRTNSTLDNLPDIEDKKTGGLLYGVISEKYKKETLPEHIVSIVYNFLYPNDQLKNGNISIIINYRLESSDILQMSYLYEHDSNLLKREFRVFSESFQQEYALKQYFRENNLNCKDYFEIGDNLIKERLIPDWLRVYPSRFTKDNWGHVVLVGEESIHP